VSRFLLTAMPFSGHVAPVLAVAASLAARNHEVRVYTGSRFRAKVEEAGARFVPWRDAPDFDENDLPSVFPRITETPGLRQLMINMEDVFIATAPAQVMDLRREWELEPWDVLASEETSVGPGPFARTNGCRWATVTVAPLNLQSTQGPPPGLGLRPGRTILGRGRDATLRCLVPLMARPLRAPVDRARAAVGLRPAEGIYDTQVFSPELILAAGVPALDFDRTDRPEHLHWIGVLRPPAGRHTPLPPWWDELEGRLVVHVTQGTQNVELTDLIRPTLDALADEDVIIVATTGRTGRDELPFPVPANARVAGFLPHDLLLPRTDVMVTNGGWGGVLAALSHGVPMVIGGANLDKPEVAARVAGAGAAIDLRTRRPSSAQVRDAVRRVADQTEPFRERARQLQADLRTAGGAERAADLLSTFATAPRRTVAMT